VHIECRCIDETLLKESYKDLCYIIFYLGKGSIIAQDNKQTETMRHRTIGIVPDHN
jgi:hypothetical protein